MSEYQTAKNDDNERERQKTCEPGTEIPKGGERVHCRCIEKNLGTI